MNSPMKDCLKNILVFLITFIVCVGTLLLVCQIPQSAIQKNSKKSAEYFSGHEGFPLLIGDKINSRSDNYADCVLLNVIYNMDSDNSFKAIIADSYYRHDGEDASDDYEDAVFNGKNPNNEYSRYWHGSQVFIRPLLTITSIEGIRLVIFGLLLALNIWLAALLVKRKLYSAAAIYFISMLLVEIWMTAFSLEYVMSFLVMTGACIAVVYAKKRATYIFIATGMVTCFLDFLTCETLTFTVPVILLLVIRSKYEALGSFKSEISKIIKYGLAWLISYGLMFSAKWLLVYAVLGKSAFINALQNAAFRIEGTVTVDGLGLGEAVNLWQRLSGVILRNLACLFPVGSHVTSSMVFGLALGTLAVLGAVFYLFRKEPTDGKFIGLLLLIGLIPYLRFLCLSNHAYIHYFFTYRAQMATVMVIFSILVFSLSPSYVLGKNNKAGKTGKKQK
ncbi:MAG: hypothetical protein GX663_04775 [Clostridiales bacterium]|nr:hypothetical protein [Clostridiales bacterium]